MSTQPRDTASSKLAVGAHAVLGMDVVSFSTLDEERQLIVIQRLMRCIEQSIRYHGLKDDEYRWSPAGDGGYLTFVTSNGGRQAIDVAFSIFERIASGAVSGTVEKFNIRAALHAGTVREDEDLGRETNIWGMGINTTARILSVSDEDQLLVSRQYFDTYIKDRNCTGYNFGDAYYRTVKHDVSVEVMNASKAGAPCLSCDDAGGKRWRYLGGLWKKTIQEYEFLLEDTLRAGDPVASIAAARYLLEMGEKEPVKRLCARLSGQTLTVGDAESDSPMRHHMVFSSMPDHVLFAVISSIVPRVVKAGEVICENGVAPDNCYFPVAGRIELHIPGRERPTLVKKGHILGEFSLWIPNLKRTARITALDSGLILELGHHALARVLEKYPDVASGVYSLIQRRIVENVLLSRDLFPGLDSAESEYRALLGAVCKQVAAGEKLDLSDHAYVLFIGRLRLQCTTGAPVEVSADGQFDQLRVVGIYSSIGKPDGPSAEVMENSVVVQISHSALADLHKRYAPIARQWGGLCGERLLEANWSLTEVAKTAGAA